MLRVRLGRDRRFRELLMIVQNEDGSTTIAVKLGASAEESRVAIEALSTELGYSEASGIPKVVWVEQGLLRYVVEMIARGHGTAAAEAARKAAGSQPLPEVL